MQYDRQALKDLWVTGKIMSEDMFDNLFDSIFFLENDNYTNSVPCTETVGAINVGTTFSDHTMQEMFDMIFYGYLFPTFSTFKLNNWTDTKYEIGEDIPINQEFNWTTTNPINVSGNTIQISGYNLTTLSGLDNDSSESVTFTNDITRSSVDGPGTRQWTIQGTNTSGTTFNRTCTLRWDYNFYMGTSTESGITESDIKSLSDLSSLRSGYAGTYYFSAGGYKYFCWSDNYGGPTFPNGFHDGAFPIDMVTTTDSYFTNISNGYAYALIPITNSEGETSNYRVYRTLNTLGGLLTAIVS